MRSRAVDDTVRIRRAQMGPLASEQSWEAKAVEAVESEVHTAEAAFEEEAKVEADEIEVLAGVAEAAEAGAEVISAVVEAE